MGDSKTKAQRRREFPPLPDPLPVLCVDNHTHLESVLGFRDAALLDAFAPNPQDDAGFAGANEQLRLAAASGIDRIVQVGCEIPSARWTDVWLRSQPNALVSCPQKASCPQNDGAAASGTKIARAVGAIAIHPNEAVRHGGIYETAKDGLPPADCEHHQIPLKDAIAEIAEIAARNKKIRAIGETGMDLFRAGPKGAEVQRLAFREHIALAKQLNLALQIHDREAHAQVIETLLHDGAPELTVFHCFSGDAEMAKLCTDQGWYLSFAGPVTYRANEELRAAVQATPLNRILAETDAPYLTPHPYRGQPNAPYVVNYTIKALAGIKGIELEAMCQNISQNSENVYGAW